MKKILLLAVLLGIISQLSYTKTDPNVERLVKIAKKKQAEQEKEAKKQQLTDSLLEEGEGTPETVDSSNQSEVNETRKAELEAKRTKEAEARKKKAEEKAMKEKYKNMTESEKMDVEIQRIKKRVEEINSNIESFHKTDEMLEKMEERLEGIEKKLD